MEMNLSLQDYSHAAKFISETISGKKAQLGVLCDGYLEYLTEIVENKIIIPYNEIPQFPLLKHKHSCTKGQVVFGNVGDILVIFFTNMLHYYDGYTPQQCVMPVKIMKLLGVKTLILANIGNSVNLCTIGGDIVFVKDHIDLMGILGHDPLREENEKRLESRFVSMNNMYDAKMIKQAKDILSIYWHRGVMSEGIYACLPGPSLPNESEIKMLNMFSVDIIGVSMVHEVIEANYSGMTVMAFILITNTSCSKWEWLSQDQEMIKLFVNQYCAILQRFLERFIKCHIKRV